MQGWNVPVGHVRHELCPVLAPYVAIGHWVQVLRPPAAPYIPDEQSRQAESPVVA